MQDRGNRGATQATSPGNLPRLLVIDDELVQRTIISKVGQQVGYEVLAVASFEEAARMLCKTTLMTASRSIFPSANAPALSFSARSPKPARHR